VEDYRLDFNILDIAKTAQSSSLIHPGQAQIGDTITYTMIVHTEANAPVTVFDPIPEGTQYVVGSAYPADGTLTNVSLYGQTVSSIKWNLPAVAPPANRTLSFKVTLNSYPVGVDSVFNVAYAVMNGDTLTSASADCSMAAIKVLTTLRNDYAQTIMNIPVTVDVLTNDSILASCTPSVDIAIQPAHGTASLLNDSIVYFPDHDFVGHDTITYSISCNGASDSAKIFIIVYEKPGNIIDADCYIDPPAQQWGIREISNSFGNDYSVVQTPLVGDIDGDGKPEIIMTNSTPSAETATNVRIIGMNGVKKTITVTSAYSGMNSLVAIGRVKTGLGPDDYKKLIFTLTDSPQAKLFAYDYDAPPAALPVWTSGNISSISGVMGAAAQLVDLDGDGWTEIVVGNKVYAAESGVLLCSGGSNEGYNHGWVAGNTFLIQTVAGNVLGNGKQQVCVGHAIYDVTINSRTTPALNTMVEAKTIAPVVYNGAAYETVPSLDGSTQLVDLDLDGNLDIIISTTTRATPVTNSIYYLYVWSPSKNKIIASKKINRVFKHSVPFVGDIDGDGYPEIVFMHGGRDYNNPDPGYDKITAMKYNPASATGELSIFWEIDHNDSSGSTGITLFDFNQDGISELVYRDNYNLRIINGSKKSHFTGNDTTAVYDLAYRACNSATCYEYPVVVDIDGDGEAEIITSGPNNGNNSTHSGPIRVFKADFGTKWAPARKVWNQYSYNAVNVNEDLTIPRYPLNPATVFPGSDGILGTPDDVRPFNNFLQQQTMLSRDGVPLWLTPDVIPDLSLTSSTVTGNSVSITVGIINQGDAAVGPPVYVTLYRESVSSSNIIATGSANIQILPGDTGLVTVNVPDITSFLPMATIVVRVNDDGTGAFPYQAECNITNNELRLRNPARHLMMKKRATLYNIQDNGAYPNPVSVLYRDTILYEIEAVYADTATGNMVITDTLPPYLEYAGEGTLSVDASNKTTLAPQQQILKWEFTELSPLESKTVSYLATPESGASASQPLFINMAYVIANDTLFATTNSTYHQGAGIAVVTFSASLGGHLFNAVEQALDYRTSPRAGILIVPDDGYDFAGWCHDDYTSLRGETIKADSGILHYEDVVIYGDVELRARFVPHKEKPIEKGIVEEKATDNSDKVWSHEKDLYIRTKKGVITRIYTTEGLLQQLLTITDDGTTTVRLERGVYVVTLNGGVGYKVIIE
jgi:uncharacterized repeat protein (TIGR01451 family)